MTSLFYIKKMRKQSDVWGWDFLKKKRKKEKIKWKKFKKGIWTKMTLNLSEESLYLEEFNKKVEWEKFPFLANQN